MISPPGNFWYQEVCDTDFAEPPKASARPPGESATSRAVMAWASAVVANFAKPATDSVALEGPVSGPPSVPPDSDSASATLNEAKFTAHSTSPSLAGLASVAEIGRAHV